MRKSKKYHSDFLFPTSSFLIGAGSILNIAGNYFTFNYSSTDLEADTKAIQSDWGVVGNDIMVAEAKIKKTLKLSCN